MITLLIIGITTVSSYLAFHNPALSDKLQFNAAKIIHQKQYYRLVSHAFIHGSWSHLLVNMFVLYFFGRGMEQYFGHYFGNRSNLYFLLLYFGGILVSNAWSLIKHQNNYYYNAVGASGAVSALLFAFIFFNPWEPLYLFAILPIPGIVFAFGYLLYSYKMSRKQSDNVAHDAHILGAIFGFLFPILLRPELFNHFMNQLFSIF